MSRLSKFMALFPALHAIAFLIVFLGSLALAESWMGLGAGMSVSAFVLYFLAPLCFRLHSRTHPIPEGASQLSGSAYSAWWGGHQLQGLYIAFPAIEASIRLIPGAYSAWLRLWGSQVGRGVYWTPRADILDRSLLEIGDRVIFGHDVALCAHVVTRTAKATRLFVKKIRIESGALLGAKSKLGPGVRVLANSEVPYGTEGRINQVLPLAPLKPPTRVEFRSKHR